MGTRIDDKIRNEIAKKYVEGKSTIKLGKEYKCSASTCSNILKEKNINRRNKYEAHRKYNIDETFFETINTEEKAYWLGFLSADGGTTKIANRIRIDLEVGDIDHLKKFKKAIKSEHKISTRDIVSISGTISHQCYFQFCSHKIKNDIMSYFDSNKSHTLIPPKELGNIESHYWRGMIDGDGGISFNKKLNRWEIYLNGTYEVCKRFADFISKELNWMDRKPTKDKRMKSEQYRILYGGNNISKMICELLYKDSTTYLNRKMKLANQIDKLEYKNLKNRFFKN